MLFEVKEVDRQFYRERLAGFLPARILDCHTHVWLREFQLDVPIASRGPTWPRRVAADNSVEDLLTTYELILPGHQVTPLIFAMPERDFDLDRSNDYVSGAIASRGLPGLLVTRPEWSAGELEARVRTGGFLGLKPYLNLAPPHIPSGEITIYDFLPHHHLELANAHGWIVLLHIPRPGRLKDSLNLAQMCEIDRLYPRVQVIMAHVGRAYCPEDVGDAFQVLRATEHLLVDFSANTNAGVIAEALRALGPRRILFGSDLPILRMRMRRICEDGSYINLVQPGTYGDVSDDPHMREVSPEEGERLSFFMYEELWAFRRAAEAVGLNTADVEDVFYNNATRTLALARGH